MKWWPCPVTLVLMVSLLPPAPAASLAASPQTITECNAQGYGRTRLYWSSEGGTVEIRVGAPDGPVLTRSSDRTGSETTGDWVNDGATFLLVDRGQRELARTTVRAACQNPPGGQPAVPEYFPLEVGNQWIYRYDSRFATGGHQVWSVTGVEQMGGRVYFVVRRDGVEARYRRDPEGRVWEAGPDGRERLWLDATADPDPAALQRMSARNQVVVGPAGVFTQVAVVTWTQGSLISTDSNYAAGVGLISQTSRLLTGSSGGFTDGLTLLSARVGGHEYSAPEVSAALSVARSRIVMRPDAVSNCALPCYYAACGLGSPVDPPGTFRPCLGAWLTLKNRGIESSPLRVRDPKIFELELAAADGTVVWRRSARPGAEPPSQPLNVGPAPLTLTESVPLYTRPNEPLPPGAYLLTARLATEDGHQYSAAVPIEIVAAEEPNP